MCRTAASRNSRCALGLLLAAAALGFAVAGAAAAPAVAQERVLADDCGYSGCHNGAPVPGSETPTPTPAPATDPSIAPTPSVVDTPCVPGAPLVRGKVKARRAATLVCALTSPAPKSTAVGIYFERKTRKSWKPWGHISVRVASGAVSLTAHPRLPSRGTWRVRALHAEAGGATSTSAWRVFKVR